MQVGISEEHNHETQHAECAGKAVAKKAHPHLLSNGGASEMQHQRYDIQCKEKHKEVEQDEKRGVSNVVHHPCQRQRHAVKSDDEVQNKQCKAGRHQQYNDPFPHGCQRKNPPHMPTHIRTSQQWEQEKD